MEKFYKYRTNKPQTQSVIQSNVLQSKTKQFRISGEALKQYDRHKEESGLKDSAFIKSLIKEALDNRENIEWQKEIAEWKC